MLLKNLNLKSQKKDESFCLAAVVFSVIVFFTLYRLEFSDFSFPSILYLISCALLAVAASLFSYQSVKSAGNKLNIIILFTLFLSEFNFLFLEINSCEFRTPLSFALFYVILLLMLKDFNSLIVFPVMLLMVILNPISVYTIPVIVFYYICRLNKKAVVFTVLSVLLFAAVFIMNIFYPDKSISNIWFMNTQVILRFDPGNILNPLFYLLTAIPYLIFIFYFYYIRNKAVKKHKLLFIFNGIIALILIILNTQIIQNIPIIIGSQILLMIMIYIKDEKDSGSSALSYFSSIKEHAYLIFFICLFYSLSRYLVFQSSFNTIGRAVARFFAVNP